MKTEVSEEIRENAKHWCAVFKYKSSKRVDSDENPELTRKRRHAEELMNSRVDEFDKLLGY